MRPPSNKALAVLVLLREIGRSTCNEIADEMRKRTPCGVCNGTGEGDDSRWGCRRCYGRGRVPFGYSDAYTALKQLRAHGLVERRRLVNEWGDETPTHIYWATGTGVPEDELEALFAAPAAEVDS